MQTYKIRRNSDGHMLYFDAKELVDLCLDNNILYGEKNKFVLVYHKASTNNPEKFPEGWYQDDYESTIHAIMQDDTAITLLLQKLTDKHIIFKPSLNANILNKN